jgi:hypothetical protein
VQELPKFVVVLHESLDGLVVTLFFILEVNQFNLLFSQVSIDLVVALGVVLEDQSLKLLLDASDILQLTHLDAPFRQFILESGFFDGCLSLSLGFFAGLIKLLVFLVFLYHLKLVQGP